MERPRPNQHSEAATQPLISDPVSDPAVEQLSPRHRDALEKLEAGYQAATTEEGFRQYLKVVSKLYAYSPRNVALIYSQRPDATMVASFDKWKEMGRTPVGRGTGIKIFYPMHRKAPDPETGEERMQLVGFGIGNVFDVSNTTGDPIPEPPTPQDRFGTSDVTAAIDRRLSLYLLGTKFRLEKGDCRNARGFFRGETETTPHNIRLAEWLPPDDGRLKTFIHEAAHYMAGHHEQGDAWVEKPRKELEAEGTAFAVLQHWGIDVSDYSFSYMAHHGRRPEFIKQVLPAIASTTRQIIEAVESEKPDGETEWF